MQLNTSYIFKGTENTEIFVPFDIYGFCFKMWRNKWYGEMLLLYSSLGIFAVIISVSDNLKLYRNVS